MADLSALTALIEPEVESLGLKLVRVAMMGGTSDPTLQIMAERPDTRQLDLADCQNLSRRISDRLDIEEAEGRDPIAHAYRLEVSSPGIDRPLTRLADYADWAGHEARVTLKAPIDNRKQFSGALDGFDPDGTVRITGKDGSAYRLPFEAIASAKLLLTDKLINATAPLSTEGADRIAVDPRPGDEVDEHFKTES